MQLGEMTFAGVCHKTLAHQDTVLSYWFTVVEFKMSGESETSPPPSCGNKFLESGCQHLSPFSPHAS